MPAVHLPYVDSALAHMDQGGPAAFWHNLHWGLYADPEAAVNRYRTTREPVDAFTRWYE